MNKTYVDHEAYKWEGYYAYSSIVGGFLHLQVGIISLPSLRSRHHIPPNFLGGKLMDIRCPPHTLQIFSNCFTHLSGWALAHRNHRNHVNWLMILWALGLGLH